MFNFKEVIMSELLNEFKKFEIENNSKLNFIGGRGALTSTVVIGTETDPNGNTFIDHVAVGSDGSWASEPVCGTPDSELGGGSFEIGQEIG